MSPEGEFRSASAATTTAPHAPWYRSIGRLDPRRSLYSPFLAQLVVTRKCNLSCGYCSEYDRVSAPVPLADLKNRADHLRRLGTFAVEFTGGEPMLHPEIYDLVRYCRRLGFVKVMMISNAYLFNAEKIQRLNDAGLQELQISIDGVKTNDVTVKVLKPLRPKLRLVAEHARFRVVLNSVMGAAPPAEVLEVIDFAREHGFTPSVQIIHNDSGQSVLGDAPMDLIEQIRQRLGRGFLDGGDYRMQLIEDGRAPFRCRAGSRYLYIDEFGFVRWCSQTRADFGIPLAEYSYADLRRQFYAYKACNEACTVGCVRKCSRFEQWRRQANKAEPTANRDDIVPANIG